MNRKEIDRAMREGAPLTCATCAHYHQGNSFCGKTECGGPGAGRDFPIYDGPIPRERFVERCLICGGGNVEYLVVGLDTKFGLCRKHRKVYNYVGQGDPDKMQFSVKVIAINPDDIPRPIQIRLPSRQD